MLENLSFVQPWFSKRHIHTHITNSEWSWREQHSEPFLSIIHVQAEALTPLLPWNDGFLMLVIYWKLSYRPLLLLITIFYPHCCSLKTLFFVRLTCTQKHNKTIPENSWHFRAVRVRAWLVQPVFKDTEPLSALFRVLVLFLVGVYFVMFIKTVRTRTVTPEVWFCVLICAHTLYSESCVLKGFDNMDYLLSFFLHWYNTVYLLYISVYIYCIFQSCLWKIAFVSKFNFWFVEVDPCVAHTHAYTSMNCVSFFLLVLQLSQIKISYSLHIPVSEYFFRNSFSKEISFLYV